MILLVGRAEGIEMDGVGGNGIRPGIGDYLLTSRRQEPLAQVVKII